MESDLTEHRTDRRSYLSAMGTLPALFLDLDFLDDVEDAVVAIDKRDQRGDYDADEYDLFLASDKGDLYVPDDTAGGWSHIETTGPNPVLQSAVIDNLQTENIGISANMTETINVDSGSANETRLPIDDTSPPYFDDFEELNNNQNKIVLKYASHHEIVAHALLESAAATGQLILRIKVNGTTRAVAESTSTTGNNISVSTSVYLKLDKGDEVTATVEHSTGSTETFPGDSEGNYLSCIRQ